VRCFANRRRQTSESSNKIQNKLSKKKTQKQKTKNVAHAHGMQKKQQQRQQQQHKKHDYNKQMPKSVAQLGVFFLYLGFTRRLCKLRTAKQIDGPVMDG